MAEELTLRILMLTDFCKPTLGGIEQHVFSLSKKLVEHGHQVVIGTVNQKELNSLDIYDGIPIYRLNSFFQKVPFVYSNPAKKYHPPFQDLLLSKELEALVNEFKPDIIHCHGWILFSYLPLKSKFKTPVIVTLHHYGFVCPKQDLFYKNQKTCRNTLTQDCYHCGRQQYGAITAAVTVNILRNNTKHFSKVDQFLAVSDFVKNSYIKHLQLPENQISTIPNFCETETASCLDCNDLPDEFILYVGQLVPYKGIDFLLDAYNLSKIDMPLVLIGGKHHAHDYKQFDDGKKIIVKENAPRELVLAAFEKCSFVVIPSIWSDPCPTTVLEAMLFGKAVIGSNSGGIPEMVVHEETGYVVDPRKTRQFADYLKLLANNPIMREKMGVAGKQRLSDNFTSETVTTAIENIYYDALKK